MLGVFNSNVTTKFVQLLYIIFYHKILGRQKTSCLPLSKLPPETRSLNGTRSLLHRLVKQKQLRLSFIALWWQNGSFQSTQSCQFFNLFFSDLTYGHESWVMTEGVLSSTSDRDGFLQSSRCGTSRQSAQLWNSQSSECRVTRPNREIPAELIGPYAQNVPGKIGRVSPSGYPTGRRFRGCPRTRWRDYISDLTWSHLGVEPTELSDCC